MHFKIEVGSLDADSKLLYWDLCKRYLVVPKGNLQSDVKPRAFLRFVVLKDWLWHIMQYKVIHIIQAPKRTNHTSHNKTIHKTQWLTFPDCVATTIVEGNKTIRAFLQRHVKLRPTRFPKLLRRNPRRRLQLRYTGDWDARPGESVICRRLQNKLCRNNK